jgi:hypothetical protein
LTLRHQATRIQRTDVDVVESVSVLVLVAVSVEVPAVMVVVVVTVVVLVLVGCVKVVMAVEVWVVEQGEFEVVDHVV